MASTAISEHLGHKLVAPLKRADMFTLSHSGYCIGKERYGARGNCRNTSLITCNTETFLIMLEPAYVDTKFSRFDAIDQRLLTDSYPQLRQLAVSLVWPT